MQRNLDTDLLRAFVAVWEENSFTKASERLFRTQAAVSMQIKRLEEQICKPVFRRDHHGLTLTEDGKLLLTYAQKILKLNDEILMTLNDNIKHMDTIRLGTPDDFAAVLLPMVLSHFRETLPNVRVEIVCGNSPSLVEEVEAGNLDLALVSSHPEAAAQGEIVRDERLFWVAAENSALQHCDPLPLALFPDGCVCRNMALRALKNANRPWKIVLASNSISTILAAVSAGLAVTVMEECIVPQNSQRLTESDGLPRLGNVHLTLHRRSDELSRGAAVLFDYLMTYLHQPEYGRIATRSLTLHIDGREQSRELTPTLHARSGGGAEQSHMSDVGIEDIASLSPIALPPSDHR